MDQAKAALSLSKITADRWVELLKTASVSEQETAEKTSDLALKKAAVEAADANLQRLKQLKIFDSVTAPFDGTITLRNTDIGQLINAEPGRNFSASRRSIRCACMSRCRSRSFMPSCPARPPS